MVSPVIIMLHERTAHMIHLLAVEIVGKFTNDVVGVVIAEQAWPVQHIGVVAACLFPPTIFCYVWK